MNISEKKEFEEVIIAIYGLQKYIPYDIIKNYIVEFAITKPYMICKKCKTCIAHEYNNKKSLSWSISFTDNQIYCLKCSNSFIINRRS